MSVNHVLKSIYHALPEPPSTNYLYRNFDVNPYSLLPPNPTIFDIGSKEARGSYAFGNPPAGAKIVCVDMFEGPGVDLVADAHDMQMVSDSSVDCVVTVSTLEHVRYPQKVVSEIYRILKPGGIVYINVPFIFPFHADPDDFYRFSCDGISILCEKFEGWIAVSTEGRHQPCITCLSISSPCCSVSTVGRSMGLTSTCSNGCCSGLSI